MSFCLTPHSPVCVAEPLCFVNPKCWTSDKNTKFAASTICANSKLSENYENTINFAQTQKKSLALTHPHTHTHIHMYSFRVIAEREWSENYPNDACASQSWKWKATLLSTGFAFNNYSLQLEPQQHGQRAINKSGRKSISISSCFARQHLQFCNWKTKSKVKITALITVTSNNLQITWIARAAAALDACCSPATCRIHMQPGSEFWAQSVKGKIPWSSVK